MTLRSLHEPKFDIGDLVLHSGINGRFSVLTRRSAIVIGIKRAGDTFIYEILTNTGYKLARDYELSSWFNVFEVQDTIQEIIKSGKLNNKL